MCIYNVRNAFVIKYLAAHVANLVGVTVSGLGRSSTDNYGSTVVTYSVCCAKDLKYQAASGADALNIGVLQSRQDRVPCKWEA